jgi:hypothetical protein
MAARYCHKQIVLLLLFTAAVFALLVPADIRAGKADPLDATVQHLIAYVARSDLTFIRNSGEYTAKEASQHMQKKYQHFRGEIGSPEKFIELCATRSLLSGKPYLVITQQGDKIKTSEWLNAELEAYRERVTGDSR